MESWWHDLGQPRLTPALREKLVTEVKAAAAARSVDELAGERDRLLIEILALKYSRRKKLSCSAANLDVPPETAQIRGNWAGPDGSLVSKGDLA